MFTSLARLATTRPRVVLWLTAALFVLAGVVGPPVAGLLNSDTDSFADRDAGSALAIERIEEVTGEGAGPELVVLVPLDRPNATDESGAILTGHEGVSRVIGGPESGDEFVSDDGSTTYLGAIYRAGVDGDEVSRDLIDRLEDVEGVTVGGFGPAFMDVNEQVEHDIVRAEMFAFPLLFLVSLWVFRSAVSALLPLLVGGLTIVVSMTVVRGINEVVEISNFAINLITGLGLGLAIDYSLFLVSRFREEVARVGPGAEAVRRTVATAGRTVVYSAVTVAGAGVALLVFPLRFLYSMGIGTAVVALVAAAVSVLVLPALFAVLGRRVDALAPKRWQRARDADARAEAHGFWYRVSTFVMRYRAGTATIGAVLLIGLGLPFLGVKFTGVDASVLPDDAPAKYVDTVLREDFSGTSTAGMVVVVDAPESESAAMDTYAQTLGTLDGVAAVAPPRYLDDDTWQVDVLPSAGALDEESLDLVGDVRALDAPGPALVGGESAIQVDQVSALLDGIPLAAAILALLTFIALFLMTGSVVLPIKALVMNVLTITVTFGILVLIFQDGRLEGLLDYTSQGALESSQPVFLFAVVFGLSTDYAVFLLTRIKEARDAGAGDREAVALGLQRTGRIVTAAAVLFAIALGAFATSEIIFIKQLGLGVAVAVLIDAFVVRALLVPSLMAMLGRANWWAPRALRRLHDRIGLSEGDPGPAPATAPEPALARPGRHRA